MNETPSTVSEVMLDRFLADDVNAEQRARIEAAIAASPELAARVVALRAERAQFLLQRPSEMMAARIAHQARHRTTVRTVRSAARRVHWLAPALATAASIALVFKLWPNPETANAPPPHASIVTHDVAPYIGSPSGAGASAVAPPTTTAPPREDAPQGTYAQPAAAKPSAESVHAGAKVGKKEAASDKVFGGAKGSLDERFGDAFAKKTEAPATRARSDEREGGLGGGFAAPPQAQAPAQSSAQPPPQAAPQAAPHAPPQAAPAPVADDTRGRLGAAGASAGAPSPADGAATTNLRREAAPTKQKAAEEKAAPKTKPQPSALAESEAPPAAVITARFSRQSGGAQIGEVIGFTLSTPAHVVVLAQSGGKISIAFDSSGTPIAAGHFALRSLAANAQTLWLFASGGSLDVPQLVTSLQANHPQRPQAVLPLRIAE